MIKQIQFHVDQLIADLAEMQSQDKFDQWVSYLLESIEEGLGEDALKQTADILQERLEHGRW
jgi:hypothetical protein